MALPPSRAVFGGPPPRLAKALAGLHIPGISSPGFALQIAVPPRAEAWVMEF
jgi:hypothetical protein